MNKIGIFNCKINDCVEFVCNDTSIGDENYYKRVKGKITKKSWYKQIGKIQCLTNCIGGLKLIEK